MLLTILGILFICILFLPLSVKKVERNIEVFLLVMAVIAVTASHFLGAEACWTWSLVESSLVEPVKLTVATLIFGIIFRMLQEPLKRRIVTWESRLGPRIFVALIIFSLGILSSLITAIIAALILCEIISALSLDRKYETIFTVLACFSIGMGAALTPIGEPLSTIAIARLRGGVHTADSLFLLKLVGIYVVPGIVFLSVVGAMFRGVQVSAPESLTEDYPESMKVIALRAWKVYVFVMALILLGNGFKPVIDTYIAPLTAGLLYWINISSAVLDNATLAAAELGSHMSRSQITGILMGMIISGGMLIPGNIPNIIAASKLKISSRSWAMIGLPVGLFLMCTYFFILFGI
jgi:predicted cation transporter